MSVHLDATVTTAPKYARFSRRFRGIVLDWMIVMGVLFGAVMLASMVRNDNFSRVLGVLVITTLLLYEPVLVSFTGSTLGHYFTNLRVVDERSGGNVASSRPVPASRSRPCSACTRSSFWRRHAAIRRFTIS